MRGVRALDERTRAAPFLLRALRYVFPEHWSFLLGEIVLYSFVVLVLTGIYLTFFFHPSGAQVVYQGPYEPLRGTQMTEAYASAMRLSFEVRAGLLVRQTHHWAANVFLVALVLHVARIMLTGAFRAPRTVTYLIGVTLLALALFEGFLGDSLLDDLMSGMGLAIANGVLLSVPFFGGPLALALFGGAFPSTAELIPRIYIAHVLLLPIAIGALIGLHLLFVALHRHSQFGGDGRTERNVVGMPLWPAYALRSISLGFAVAAVLVLLGGLVQINPVWLWGPFEPWLSTNGAQPDWYLGWLIGALRLMPGWELVIGDVTPLPNAFFGGVLFPLLVFATLYAWPVIARRLSGDDSSHQILYRPREAPTRTAAVVAMFTVIGVVLVAGAADRLFVSVGIPYRWSIWALRVLFFVGPVIAFLVTRTLARDLAARERFATAPSE